MLIEQESLKVIEDLNKKQKRIYGDACDIGIYCNPCTDNKIKTYIRKLVNHYGMKIEKWYGGSSVSIFIPVEINDNNPMKYDGIYLRVSKNVDPRRKRFGKPIAFWSIDIDNISILPTEAVSRYNSKYFRNN